MGDFRGCQRHSQVFESVREGLREREPHGRVGLDKFSVLEEVVAAIGGTAQDLKEKKERNPLQEGILRASGPQWVCKPIPGGECLGIGISIQARARATCS